MANIYHNEELTWAGVSKRFAKGEDKLLKIAETIDQDLSWLNFLALKPGNGTQGNEILQRTADASVYKKEMGAGTPSSASETVAVVDPCVAFQSFTEIEEQVYNKAPEPQRLLSDEALSHIRSHKASLGRELIYGNGLSNSMNGIANRIKVSTNAQFVDADGETDGTQTSIYMFSVKPEDNYLWFPLNSKGGLGYQNLGKIIKTETVNRDFGDGKGIRTAVTNKAVIMQQYDQTAGFSNAHQKQIVRIGNIDVDEVLADDSSSPSLFKLILQGKAKMFDATMVHALVNPEIYAYFEIQAFDKGNMNVSFQDMANGYRFVKVGDVYLHRAYQVSKTEDVVA